MQFKVGDVVRISEGYNCSDSANWVGSVGVIAKRDPTLKKRPHTVVTFDGRAGHFGDEELESIDNPKDTIPS